jgi:ubiquinone/menaquinone biosynthesis C-methylase UbiE
LAGRLPNCRVTDISPAILEYAAGRCAALGNVTTREMDGEDLAVDPGQFDSVISRLGLIYLPDQQRALRGMREALRAPGRHDRLRAS